MKAFYLHDKKRFPVACVATQLKMSGVTYNVSTYNFIDEFSKKIAQDVAIGRLHTAGGKYISAGRDVKARILQSIAEDHDMPTRTREAAKLWLKNPPKPKIKKSKAA